MIWGFIVGGLVGVIFVFSIEAMILWQGSKEKARKREQRYEIKVDYSYSYMDDGMIRYENHLAYCIKRLGYLGYIDIDVRKASYEETQKIAERLKKWAAEEERKNILIDVMKDGVL
jgi:hypothetical protein